MTNYPELIRMRVTLNSKLKNNKNIFVYHLDGAKHESPTDIVELYTYQSFAECFHKFLLNEINSIFIEKELY